MTIRHQIFRFCALLLMPVATAMSVSGHVLDDFEAAQTRAKLEKKDLILSFSGFRWWYETVGINSMTDDPWINERFIMVEVGIPFQPLVKESDQNEDEHAIRKIRRQFHQLLHEPSPCILILDESGVPYAELDSNEQPAEAYIAELQDALLQKKKRDQAFQRAKQVSGIEKSRLLDEGLKAMCEIELDGVSLTSALQENLVDIYYQDVVDQIIKNDPGNTLGLHDHWMERVMIFRELVKHQAINQQLDDLAAELNRLLLEAEPLSTCIGAIDQFMAAHPKLPAEAKERVIMGKVEVALILRDYRKARMMLDEMISSVGPLRGVNFLKSSLKPEIDKAFMRTMEGVDSSASVFAVSLSRSLWDKLIEAEGEETREKLKKITERNDQPNLGEVQMDLQLSKIELLLRLRNYEQALAELDLFIKLGSGSKQAQLRDRELRPLILLGLNS